SISADKLTLSGALTLGGTSTLTLDLGGLTSTTGGPIVIVQDGSRTGTFTTVNVINNPNGFQAVVGYTATTVTVNLVAAGTHFSVTAPATATAGQAFTITVTALDQFNNVAATYLGTVHFTKSDSGAGSAVPANYTFVAADNGVHTFTNGVTFVTTGSQTVTATDTVTSSITGSATVTVNAAAAATLTVTAPASATAGSAFT